MKPSLRVIAAALVFVALVLFNYLASSLPVRLDATADHIYPLSAGTRALLGRLEEPVELDFYFSRSNAGLPLRIKNYAARVEEMLRQYVRASRGRLTLKVIDPRPDTPEEEKATAAGLTPQVWPQNNERFQFGLVAIQADAQKIVPAFTEDRERFLEYDLSQVVFQVQQFDRRKLGLLSSLPLRAEMDFMAMQTGRMPSPQFVVNEWEKTFEIVPVEPTAGNLPAGLDVLAVIHPQNLSPKLQFAIDQFLLAGQPVFLVVDPSSRSFKARGQQGMMMGGGAPGVTSDLPTLFKAWGIAYRPDELVGDLESELSVRSAAGVPERMPIWLALSGDDLNDHALPTSQLNSIWLFEAGSLSLAEGSKLTLTPLLQTSANSGTLQSMLAGFAQPEDLARQIKPTGRKTLAALFQGKFTSAFPDGLPEQEKSTAESEKKDGAATPPPPAASAAPTPNPEPKTQNLKESSASSTLLLITDSDWLLDDYSVRNFNFLGIQAAEPLNDNLAFASNALEFLSGSSDLISIRGKGTSVRPFKVVHDMEVKAQMQYQEKLDELEKRINEVQSRLTELEGKKGEGGRLVAAPEVAKAIEDFRLQQVKLRAERREIRHSLREGIEALGNRLLVVNLLVSPLLVGVFGFWFHQHRKKQ